MAVIKIKRSATTGTPVALGQGEMGYSWLGGSQSNGGDRLYIGTGTETDGVAANIEAIGGKYFTEKLDHIPGVLTANSALIVDANKKLAQLLVDNIDINGNSISTATGDLTLSPSGNINASSNKIINLADPSNPQDAVTLNYLTNNSAGGNLEISGDTGTDTVNLSVEVLNFEGATGISIAVSNNNVNVDLDDTSVAPGSYGGSSTIPTFTVDQQGRLTAASHVSASIAHTQVNDWNEAVQDTVGAMVFGSNNEFGISVSYDDTNGVLDFNVDDFTITLAGDLSGSATITNLGNATLNATIQPNSVALGTDTTGSYVNSLVQGTGVVITNNSGENATPTIAIGQAVGTTDDVTFNDVTVNGALYSDDITAGTVTINGDLTVSGNTTIVNTEEINLADNIIVLNSNIGAAAPTQDSGITIHRGTSANVSLYWNESTDKWTVDSRTFVAGTFEGNLTGNITGDVTGNADTATALATARTFSLTGDVVATGISFDGTGNVALNTTIQPNSVALGTDTTGNYVATISATGGTGIQVSGSGSENSAITISGIDATDAVKGVASFDETNFLVTSGDVAIAEVDGGTY